MTDKPILFSATMVRALLAGTKTQTRRTIKSARVFATPDQPAFTLKDDHLARAMQNSSRWRRIDGDGWHWEADAFEWQAPSTRTGWLAHIGHAPGDRLWVREAHAMLPRTAYRMSIGTGTIDQREHPTDGYSAAVFREGFDRSGRLQWRPSIHMPRWASRITLTVTEVRVQRLQDISAGDAIAEGVECATCVAMGKSACNRKGCFASIAAYRYLWNAINAQGAWEANPWVAAYSFTCQRRNIDQLGST